MWVCVFLGYGSSNHQRSCGPKIKIRTASLGEKKILQDFPTEKNSIISIYISISEWFKTLLIFLLIQFLFHKNTEQYFCSSRFNLPMLKKKVCEFTGYRWNAYLKFFFQMEMLSHNSTFHLYSSSFNQNMSKFISEGNKDIQPSPNPPLGTTKWSNFFLSLKGTLKL